MGDSDGMGGGGRISKRLRWDDIPLHILRAVLQKWLNIFSKGIWTDRYWNSCALCGHMQKVVSNYHCNYCPAGRNQLCRGMNWSNMSVSADSKLCYDYYQRRHRKYRSKKSKYRAWLMTVAYFLVQIRSNINRRTDID